jgi:hypothetical protein
MSSKTQKKKKSVERGQTHANALHDTRRQVDNTLVRIASGVAAFLFLDRDKLLDRAVEILDNCSVDVKTCDVDSIINKIYDILRHHEYWDDSYVGSYYSYYYASAIAAWLYLHNKLGGLALPCSEDVAHAITMMLTTLMAKFVGGAVRRCREQPTSEVKAI